MKNKLVSLLKENQGNITEEVIYEALDYDDPKLFFEDLLKHGCISGMVGSLIYYKDTHDFYEKHYEEIEAIRDELVDEGIEICLPSHNDLKNFFAWMSFEHRAKNLYDELYAGR